MVSLNDPQENPHSFEITVTLLKDNSQLYFIIFTDVTAMQNEKKLYEILASRDPITKIYNRQKFNDFLIKEHENIKRHEDKVSIIMFDIDHFKNINDTYGHNVGDNVLVLLVQLVKAYLRANDIFARWGGEEFMILLPRTGGEVAYEKALQLKQLIEEYAEKGIPKFTVSFGVTEIIYSQ